MTIAIDIDGTFDKDKEFWLTVMLMAMIRNHRVIVVTGSKQPQAKIESLSLQTAIILTCQPGEFKKDCALRHGYSVSVWIDNEPGTIEPSKILPDSPSSSL